MRIASLSLFVLCLLLLTSCGATVKEPLRESQQAMQEERFDDATSFAEIAFERNPQQREVRVAFARALRTHSEAQLENGSLEEAYELRLRAAEVEPKRTKRAGDWERAAELARDLGNLEDALAALQKSLEADSTNIEIRRKAAQTADEMGKIEPAVHHYLWLWETDRSAHRIGLRLANLYLELEQPADAEAVYARVLDTAPDNVQAALGRIDALERLGKNDALDKLWNRLVQEHSNNPGILIRYADYLDKKGRTEAAQRWRARARDALPGVERRDMRRLR